MKPTSERMLKVATERRIRTPAIWTILKDYAGEVKELEEKNKTLMGYLQKIADVPREDFNNLLDALDKRREHERTS